MTDIYESIKNERIRQDSKHGNPTIALYPKGFNFTAYEYMANTFKETNDKASSSGVDMNWHDILREEFLEAFGEPDKDKMVIEFIQLAALCVKVIEKIEKGEIIA